MWLTWQFRAWVIFAKLLMKVFMKHDYNSFGVGAHLFAFGFTKESELGAEVVGTFVLVYIVFSATDWKKSPCDSHIPKTIEAVAGVVAFLHGAVGSTARTDIGTFTDFDGANCPAQASRGQDELIVPNMTLVIGLGKHEVVLAGASSPKMEAMVAMVVDRHGTVHPIADILSIFNDPFDVSRIFSVLSREVICFIHPLVRNTDSQNGNDKKIEMSIQFDRFWCGKIYGIASSLNSLMEIKWRSWR
ncbi:aquaporin PIP2-7-like [Macadamia integrifolia]|uniref:aquaporin PIP2-7-like n=1 Tax=Macadamia integrifolia TaxID=60698 RepID=UPI001C4F3556|nr:aquaporin PIP2-7-like [Macadamia integrifolia]